MKYVSDKDRKPFCADLKTIYQAPTEEKALDALERVTEKWSEKYPNSMRSWKQNWDAISPIFKFSTPKKAKAKKPAVHCVPKDSGFSACGGDYWTRTSRYLLL